MPWGGGNSRFGLPSESAPASPPPRAATWGRPYALDFNPGLGRTAGSALGVRLGDRPRIRPRGGTGALVDLRGDGPAPRGVGERAGAAGHGVSARGSEHTLAAAARTLKVPIDGQEHTVRPVGPDEDRGAAKVPLMILDTRQRSRDVPQMRRGARNVTVQLDQPARQVR